MKLTAYQKEGTHFLLQALHVYQAALLADEMGMGKTAQALEVVKLMQAHASRRQLILVITRNSIKSVWEEELKKWYSEAYWFTVPSGTGIGSLDRQQVVLQAEAEAKQLSGHLFPVFLIVHYDALRLLVDDLCGIKFDFVIADECQDVKNRKTKRTRALKQIPAKYKLGVSGTPLVNRPDELWSLLNWFFPKDYRGYWKFFEKYVDYQLHPYLGVRMIKGAKNEQELHDEISSFMIRRLKKDYLTELPDKYYTKIFVDMHPTQRRVYDEMKKESLAWIGEQEDLPILASSVLARLTRLRQFADAYAEIEALTNDEGEPTGYKVHLREPSTKLDALMDILRDTAEDKSVVIFTQFRDMVEMAKLRLQKEGITFVEYHGGVSEDDRKKAIQAFQEGQARVFVGTVQTGGAGITLTRADTLIFLDRSWSPAVNLQAEDRLHRVGQKNAVQIILLVARGTVDEAVEAALEYKWAVIRSIIEGRQCSD